METKRRIARGIVRFRIPVLVIMLLLAAGSALMIRHTRINYDLSRYLSEDTMTRRAMDVMAEEFESGEQLRIMFSDLPEEQLGKIVRILNDRPEVRIASHDPENDTREDGHVRQLVTLTLRDGAGASFVTELRKMFPDAGEYAVGGTVAAQLDIQRSVGNEIPEVMLIAVGIVLLVLLLTSHAWAEPAVILIVLAVSIVINMGTNFIFPDVSFVTFAVCAILQLALSIDYAIMLLHTFNACRDGGMDGKDAMTEALAQCFMRIGASAFTTIAGLLSLLFMSFTIGFDIGLVLSKGILITLVGVFLLMPSVTLLFEKPLRATRHRPVRLGGGRLAAGIYRARKPLAAVLVLAVCAGAYLSSRNVYSFTDSGTMQNSESARINRVFGASNPLVLLVPGGEEDTDYDRQRELVSRLEDLRTADGSPAVPAVTAMVTTGAQALKYYTVPEVAELTGMAEGTVALFFRMQGFGTSVRADRLLEAAEPLAEDIEEISRLNETLKAARELFNGPRYTRMLLETGFQPSDADFAGNMESIFEAVRGVYGEEYYITGNSMSAYDISHAFRGDLLKVNLLTLLAILLIVVISFRSVRLPVLIVLVIEGAIWITMGISRITGESIFFISYLICLSIQMGATIDYGILVCDQYRNLRREGLDVRGALTGAMERSLPTMMTSGIILITAGYVIGRRCSIYYISSIGLLVSRGALVSVVLVLTLLPALLALLDRWVIRPAEKRKA